MNLSLLKDELQRKKVNSYLGVRMGVSSSRTTRPPGYKTFIMLNSTEHEITTKPMKNKEFCCFKAFRCCIYPANKC